jgi:hypothetical protein
VHGMHLVENKFPKVDPALGAPSPFEFVSCHILHIHYLEFKIKYILFARIRQLLGANLLGASRQPQDTMPSTAPHPTVMKFLDPPLISFSKMYTFHLKWPYNLYKNNPKWIKLMHFIFYYYKCQ